MRALPNQAELAQARMARELRVAARRREHYWIAIVGYHVDPGDGHDIRVTHTDVRVPPTVGCYVCEEAWSPELAAHECTGEPS